MTRRLAIGLLAPVPPLMLALVFSRHELAQGAFALLAVLFPAVLIPLGAARGNTASAGWPALTLGLTLTLSSIGLLVLARDGAGQAPVVAGLPLGALLLLVGLGLLPLLLVTVGYAATFRRSGIGEADLERLRSLKRRSGRSDADGSARK